MVWESHLVSSLRCASLAFLLSLLLFKLLCGSRIITRDASIRESTLTQTADAPQKEQSLLVCLSPHFPENLTQNTVSPWS